MYYMSHVQVVVATSRHPSIHPSIHLSLRLSFLFAVQIACMLLLLLLLLPLPPKYSSYPVHPIPSHPIQASQPSMGGPNLPLFSSSNQRPKILLREARGNRANLPPVPPFSFRNQSRTHARTVCRVPTSQTQNQKPKKLAPNSKTTRSGGNPRKQNGPRAARGVHKTKDAVRAP